MISLANDRDLRAEMNAQKFAFLQGEQIFVPAELHLAKQRFIADWKQLEPDEYLKHRSRFRLRRFGWFRFAANTGDISPMTQDCYRQASSLNRYAGDVPRTFSPLSSSTKHNEFLHALIRFDFQQLPVSAVHQNCNWAVDVHQIRILATSHEAGQPTPEGMHRDGDDYVCVHLIARHNICGGESKISTDDGKVLFRSHLANLLDTLLIWDPHVLHGVSPILPEQASALAHRDALLIGFVRLPDGELPANAQPSSFPSRSGAPKLTYLT